MSGSPFDALMDNPDHMAKIALAMNDALLKVGGERFADTALARMDDLIAYNPRSEEQAHYVKGVKDCIALVRRLRDGSDPE